MNTIKELLDKIWLNKKDVKTLYVEDTEEVRGYTFRSLDVSAIESVLPQLQDEASKLDISMRFGKGKLEYGNGCDYYNNKPIRKSYIYIGKDVRVEQSVDVLDALA